MSVPGLDKQMALTMIATLNQVFDATSNQDGTFTGHWVDDGGFSQTIITRGAWSTEPTKYPQIVVKARASAKPLVGAGGIIGVYDPGNGGPLVPKRGGILDRAEVHCLVKTPSEDERDQVADLLRSTIDGGQNASAVPWRHVLKTSGFEPLWWGADQFSEDRQDGDPGHGPVVYKNDLVLFARAQYVYVPTVVPIQSITLRATLVVGPGVTPAWTF